MHFTAGLVAEQGGGFVIPQRQIAIGAAAVEISLVLERAGHGTQGKNLFVLFLVAQHKHALFVVAPVAGQLIQVAFRHIGRLGEQPAALLLLILHKTLQKLNDARPLRQQDRQALPDQVGGGEQLQLPSQLVVVAFFGFFELFQMGLQLRRLGERYAVNALQHFVVRVAPPVSASDAEQLVRLDAAGIRQMRAGAQVGKVPLPVERDFLLFRQVANQFHLVGFVLHQLQRLGAGEGEPLDGKRLFNDFFHLGFNFDEVIGG